MEGDAGFSFFVDTVIPISIHSLRMEGDGENTSFSEIPKSFQSTPSAWRETAAIWKSPEREIHFNPLPPHGGRRRNRLCNVCNLGYFNPLPPHGGRLGSDIDHADVVIFQSTPSAWRETW